MGVQALHPTLPPRLPPTHAPPNESTTAHESWLSLARLSGSLPGREYSHQLHGVGRGLCCSFCLQPRTGVGRTHRTGSEPALARRMTGMFGSALGSTIFALSLRGESQHTCTATPASSPPLPAILRCYTTSGCTSRNGDGQTPSSGIVPGRNALGSNWAYKAITNA